MSRIGALLLFSCFVLSACGGSTASPPTAPMASPTAVIESLEGFEVALSEAANSFKRLAQVEAAAPLQGYSYLVNGHQVIALETVESTDGQSVDGLMADFARDLSANSRHWHSGDLGVFYPGDDGGVILLISGLLGDPQTLEATVQDEPYPPAVLASIRHVSEKTGIDPSNIRVDSFVRVTWPDSCLGLPGPDEGCAEALVEGWQVRLRVDDQVWQVHTDEVGQQVRSQQNPG